jgi:Carboxypeptidase regulatory-like domain
MKIIGPGLIISAVLAIALAGNAKVSVGTIEGTVVDAHDQPVAGASVTIQTSDGQHPHATHTDASGHFQFARFATGQYDLRAYFKGAYSDWDKRVPLSSHKPTEITLRIASTSKP